MKNTSKSTRITVVKMTELVAEIRFEKARERLSEALKNLEEVVKKKFHEEAIYSRMIDGDNNGYSVSQSRMIEQSQIIQNLNSEINNLQKNLSELGKETDFLREKNEMLIRKITKMKAESEGAN